MPEALHFWYSFCLNHSAILWHVTPSTATQSILACPVVTRSVYYGVFFVFFVAIPLW